MIVIQPKGSFCQSCSMPLSQSELIGTEKDATKNKKYCIYCYKDGNFTLPDVTMEEMIEISAKGWSEQNPEMSYEQAKTFLQQCIPHLERWKS